MNDVELHDLAFEFFKVFSRFEYALKAAGFHKGEGPAEANWDNFATAIDPHLSQVAPGVVKDAIEFLLAQPPKKQFIGTTGLEWRSVPANQGSPAKDLFTYVRRVRNNLFHGGKFNEHWFAPERSEKLLMASIVVMHWAIGSTPRVRMAYES